jgi:ParB family chromosome partitioning protein
MRLEFQQLERRWEHLRVREPQRQRQLIASLAEAGQQTPIVVVPDQQDSSRYVVIDGYKRIAALGQLRQDTVEATVWAMTEAEALLLDRWLRFSRQECALEQGWLLSEMAQHFGYSLEELARRFDRSMSWVSRRLALVELLPESIQQQVREANIAAQTAMKYLVPMARRSVEDCERMAAAFALHRCDSRQAAQLYRAWRDGSRVARERILAQPELFLKALRQPSSPPATQAAALGQELETAAAILRRAGRRNQGGPRNRAGRRTAEALAEMNAEQRRQALRQIESVRRELDRMAEQMRKDERAEDAQPVAANHDSGTARTGCSDTRDRARDEAVAADGAQSAAVELRVRSGDSPRGKSRTIPAGDPRTADPMQGESRASS